MNGNRLAVIGSGPTAIYLLKHIGDHAEILQKHISEITIFERRSHLGMGMPYSPETTDIFNLANISSEEIPELPESFGDWLRRQEDAVLSELNVKELPIDDTEVYSRIALGAYLHEQYQYLTQRLENKGIAICEKQGYEVSDVEVDDEEGGVVLKMANGESQNFSRVVIATGHAWGEADRPESGFYGSPWPIHKLLPKKGTHYNFTIGTLGASLSAFDVVTSLAHRHGKFVRDGDGLTFKQHPDASDFRMVMHSAEGWLPHLQYEQEEPIREIYRHTTREEMLAMRDPKGFLRIADFYDKVCRPALKKAFTVDNLPLMVEKLERSDFSFSDFVSTMTSDHEYSDSFKGMKKEMVAARDSVENDKPIHWKETLDDLMYCLNFHAELLPAEDHLFFQKEVMAFLMNVIAALPLSSANILLALYDAGCLDLITGKVRVLENAENTGITLIEVEDEDGTTKRIQYQIFINCAGQKSIDLEAYPFNSLVRSGHVKEARAQFSEAQRKGEVPETIDREMLIKEEDGLFMCTGGIDVDAAYRVIGKDGEPNDRIFDITFTHTSGIRPYSYGLQACNATSKILVEAWVKACAENEVIKADIRNITEVYDENDL